MRWILGYVALRRVELEPFGKLFIVKGLSFRPRAKDGINLAQLGEGRRGTTLERGGETVAASLR